MYTDAFGRLAEDQAITTTANSDYSYDLEQNRDFGAGEPLEVLCSVTEAFAGGTSVTPSLVVSAAAGLGTPTTLVSLPAIVTASLTLGKQFSIPIPRVIKSLGLQYLGLVFTVSGTYTAGKITADIIPAGCSTDLKFYPVGTTISI